MALSVEDVCAAALPAEPGANQIHWNPDGSAIAFFKPLPGSFGLHMELDTVDRSGSKRETWLTSEQIDRLFPSIVYPGTGEFHPPKREPEFHPPPIESIGFEWAPDGSAVLLYSNTAMFWLGKAANSSEPPLRKLAFTKDATVDPLADIQLSPDGKWASFVRGHNLWVVSTSGGSERAITLGGNAALRKGELDWMYPAELGTKHGYAWSPDSSRIAYLEFNLTKVASYTPPFQPEIDGPARTIDYPAAGSPNPLVHVFVREFNPKSRTVLINTGSDQNIYLPLFRWLPDSKQLAIERLDRPQSRLELLIADASSGASRVAVTDTDQYWINLSDTLYFLKSAPQFIWSSERSGYRHLYLYDLDGKLVRQLTKGPWEVTSLDAVDEKQHQAYFTSTEKSPLERHLYVADLSGSVENQNGSRRVSSNSGTHEATFSPDASAYVDRFSTATKPWTYAIYQTGPAAGTKLFSLEPATAGDKLPSLHPVDFLTIKTHDQQELNGFMMRPADFSPDKKYPAIIYVDGRPGHQAVRDRWDGDLSMWRQMLVERGFIVFAIDGRGSAGRGHLFEEYVHLRFTGQEMLDQRDGVQFLQSLPYIDPARVGIWGRGYGASLTLDAMMHAPLYFKAGFAWAPIVDWSRYDSAFTERYLSDPIKNQDGYLSSSSLDYTKSLKSPLFVAQGMADFEVHPDQTMQLQRELVGAGRYAEITLLPGQGHPIDKPDACSVLYSRATQFFAKAL